MRIVVNHLTRMQPGYICVAGVDTRTAAHVRPVLTSRLTRNLLARSGGLFDIGTLVDLGSAVPVGRAPEVEDHEFSPNTARVVNLVAASDYWNILRYVSRSRLTDIFGSDLKRNGNGCVVPVGHGIGSLGCLIPAGRPQLYIDSFDKVRLRFTDGNFDVSPSVTDLRLYKQDQKTPRPSVIADLQRRISQGVDIILSVGLARAWKKQGDTQEYHWLQVNGVHLADNPVWQVGEEDDEDDNTNADDLPF